MCAAKTKTGTTNGNSKLTPYRVQAIRDARRVGFGREAIAASARVAGSTVSDICTGKLWKELPDKPAAELIPVRLVVDPVGVLAGEDDAVLLISGNTAHELVRVDVVLCRGPLTDEELSRD